MDKRLLLTIVFSMGIVLLFTMLGGRNSSQSQQQTATATVPTANPANVPPSNAAPAADKAATPDKPAADKAAGDKPAAATAKADAVKPVAKAGDAKATDAKAGDGKTADVKAADAKPAGPPAPSSTPAITTAVVEQPGFYRATFTNHGAAPEHWQLLDPRYKEEVGHDGQKSLQPIDLVRTRFPNLPLEVALLGPKGTLLAPDAIWHEEPRGGDGAVVYTWEDERIHVEKRYTPVPGSYEMHLVVTVENRGSEKLEPFLQLQVHGWHDPSVKSGGFLSRRVNQTQAMCDVGGKLKKADLDGLLKEKISQGGAVRWVGIGDQYFVAAAALKAAHTGEPNLCDAFAAPDGSMSAVLSVAKRPIEPHGRTSYEAGVFFGPKILAQLDRVTAGGVDAGMGNAVDYGWTEVLARPMLAALKAIYYVIPNWGVAVIVITILLKLLTWWPTGASMKSARAMAKLKPEMDKLNKLYGNDKQRLGMEQMALYKKHGINPLGGCLPLLIQMPIYFALYSMLGNSVEMYRSSFVGWIHDLTAPDPYYVLPVATGLLMFLQQRMMPPPADAQQAQQQKMLMYTMPVMFTAFNIFWPSGLTIYILTNTLLTMLQQWMINRAEPAKARG